MPHGAPPELFRFISFSAIGLRLALLRCDVVHAHAGFAALNPASCAFIARGVSMLLRTPKRSALNAAVVLAGHRRSTGP